jgi:hypothetical protein
VHLNGAIVPETLTYSFFIGIDGDVILDLTAGDVITLVNEGVGIIDLPTDPIRGATITIIQIE